MHIKKRANRRLLIYTFLLLFLCISVMYHNTSFSIFCHSDTSTSSVQALGGIYLIIKRFFTSVRSVQNEQSGCHFVFCVIPRHEESLLRFFIPLRSNQNDKIPIMSDNGQSKNFF